jgi:hypothetical protein
MKDNFYGCEIFDRTIIFQPEKNQKNILSSAIFRFFPLYACAINYFSYYVFFLRSCEN